MHTRNNSRKLLLKRTFALLATLLVAIVSACAPRATPPGADVAAGVVGQAGYEFLHWEEGLAIMIWHDFLGHSGSSSTSGSPGFTVDPMYKLQGYAESWDGHRFDWKVQANDGKTANFWLDGTPYDLSDGALFVVTMKNGRADVTQLDRDLSRVEPNHRCCVAFAQSDPDLAQFVGDVPTTPVASPTSVPGATPTPQVASPTPSPPPNTITPPGSWITYTNSVHRFSLRHPPGYDVPPTDLNESRGFIGDQIAFSVAVEDPYWLDCFFESPGDCPVIEQTELTRVGDPARNAIRISGFIGSIGGRIPQQYVTYLMREGGMYYTFTLYALGRDSEIERVDVIWPLGEADIVTFERVMETLTFQVGPLG